MPPDRGHGSVTRRPVDMARSRAAARKKVGSQLQRTAEQHDGITRYRKLERSQVLTRCRRRVEEAAGQHHTTDGDCQCGNRCFRVFRVPLVHRGQMSSRSALTLTSSKKASRMPVACRFASGSAEALRRTSGAWVLASLLVVLEGLTEHSPVAVAGAGPRHLEPTGGDWS